tara:strand:+ start:1109 stop:1639 length:531 start_codon:yes stop_codon:yes gene_type:complete
MFNLQESLKKEFASYKDFPKPGIIFCDILPVLRDTELFRELIYEFGKINFIQESDAIIAIDARGFIFGSALSFHIKKPLILARKPGKLPGELITYSYKLEYGENTLCLQKKAINNYHKFCILDDLLATGGTARAVEKMLLNQSKEISGLAVVVELLDLKGSTKLNCPVRSIVGLTN